MLRIWALILLNLQVIGKTTKKTLPFLQSKANTSVQACNEGSSWTVSSAANERKSNKTKTIHVPDPEGRHFPTKPTIHEDRRTTDQRKKPRQWKWYKILLSVPWFLCKTKDSIPQVWSCGFCCSKVTLQTSVVENMKKAGITTKKDELLKATRYRHRACTIYEKCNATPAERPPIL